MATRIADPCTLVIFGASGDLTARKLMPALYDLAAAKLLPDRFVTVGFARTELSDEEFRKRMRRACEDHRTRECVTEVWDRFARGMHYVAAGAQNEESYGALAETLQKIETEYETGGNRLFYLAMPPAAYLEVLDLIGKTGLARSQGWTRVVVEKPFGRDLASARALDERLHGCFDEKQIFRIDHYLGKETVQNLFVLRFANGIIEPVWNRRYIDNVQITVAESLGVEHRAAYYDAIGAMRDMLQNHLLQLLTLTAMEPPVDFTDDVIRDEKVKVLHALRQGGIKVVRGQYGPGSVGGERVPGYRQEEDVASDSTTETFVAARCFVENWRWAGVPFYLRSGKRLPLRASEVVIEFKQAPFLPFRKTAVESLEPNRYVINIQPDEGSELWVNTKIPGPGELRIANVPLTFDYESFSGETPDAYQRLLLDAMLGDATLFTRSDEVMRQWEFVDPLLGSEREPEPYAAGAWGPPGADKLLARDGRVWHDPSIAD